MRPEKTEMLTYRPENIWKLLAKGDRRGASREELMDREEQLAELLLRSRVRSLFDASHSVVEEGQGLRLRITPLRLSALP